ncbi:trypsin-like serine protease [Streptomyces sp. NPDC003042]
MSDIRPLSVRMNAGLATATAAAVASALLLAGNSHAVGGSPAADGSHGYAVKLTIGDLESSKACSGALVDDLWVLTASSCFAATPGAEVPAGKPAVKTTATLSDQKTVEVAEIVPRTDRDVVMARLAAPVAGIAGVKRAGAAPAGARM